MQHDRFWREELRQRIAACQRATEMADGDELKHLFREREAALRAVLNVREFEAA